MKRIVNAVLGFWLYFCTSGGAKPAGQEMPGGIPPQDAFRDGDGKEDDPLVLKQYQGPKLKDVHMLLAAHSSHASHASHRSGSSGGYTPSADTPRPIYVTPPSPQRTTGDSNPYSDNSAQTIRTTPPSQWITATNRPAPQQPAQYTPAGTASTNTVWTARDLYLQGIQLYRKDQFKDAEEKFLSATKMDAGSARYHHALGLARYRNGDIAQALASFEQADRLTGPDEADLKAKIRTSITTAKEALGTP